MTATSSQPPAPVWLLLTITTLIGMAVGALLRGRR
jgi:hypothetical protein